MSVLTLTALARARALCEGFTPEANYLPHDSLAFGTGTLAGAPVYVLAQDARHEGGSFGATESDAVAVWLQTIIAAPAPLILFLDSGGARVSEGLRALGGFRRMFRALADVKLAGVPMLAVCGRTVFGGASMLACVADARIFFERSLFGMSGPRIVQAIAGVGDFNAEDKAFVASIMGGSTRAAREGSALMADDANALRQAAERWLAQTYSPSVGEREPANARAGNKTNPLSSHSPGERVRVRAASAQDSLKALQARLIAQRQTLERDALTRPLAPMQIPAAQLPIPNIRNAWADDGVLLGRMQDDSYLYGLIDGVWADSWHAWKLTNALLTQAETAPQVSAHIVLGCPAHATSRALEAGMISQYFSLLGLAIRHLHTCGAIVTLHIVGEAAGGVHVALGGGATRVIAYPGANIRILPKIASEQIKSDGAEPTRDDWLATGVVDALA